MATAAHRLNGYRYVDTKSTEILIADYEQAIKDTDVLDAHSVQPVLQGLFGEVGGIMSVAKKSVRDGDAYPWFRRTANEEFGDALWYLAALCRRRDLRLDAVFADANEKCGYVNHVAASGSSLGAICRIAVPLQSGELDATLTALGQATAALLENPPQRELIVDFAARYLDALHAAKLTFGTVVQGNIKKARGAFVKPVLEDLIDFDKDFSIEEQLPTKFEVRINQRDSGRSYLQWRGVFIGDPLTDNIGDPDGYRFHDVFHFAYAAILHWSPVVRALIRHKRKSRPHYDEQQDGGRAIVVEEGLTAWLFSRAKDLNYFEGQDKVSLGLRKTIHEFVTGYEVEQCPLSLWETAILSGYDVFRQVRAHEGGWIVGDRETRTLSYRPLEAPE
jgi:hypothetical protein